MGYPPTTPFEEFALINPLQMEIATVQLKDCIVSFDALHTQKETIEGIFLP